MQRRDILKAGLAAAFFYNSAAQAHTPYKQWQVYRKKHLLIGCLKDRPLTYELAKTLVNLFANELPRANARVARAPNSQRIASLMATGQLDTAIIPVSLLTDMATGNGVYAAYGKIPLRVIFLFENLALVGLDSMPDHHALLIHNALLTDYAVDSNFHAAGSEPKVPWHHGIVEHGL